MLFKNLKAHASQHVLATLAVCVLMPLPAFAQSGNTPVFTPASSWAVGSTELGNVRGLNAMKLPCVISNEFDNGFVIRFSGGGNQMLAMAVDFRQDVFKQGRKYDAMLSIGDAYVKQVQASAFTSSTLIFNLRPLNDFYNTAKNGRDMEINIDGNAMKFSLGKLAAAYPALESCYAGEKTTPVKPMLDDVKSASIDARVAPAAVPSVEAEPVASAAPQAILPPAIAAAPMPKSFDEIMKNGKIDGESQMKVSQVTPRVPDAPKEDAIKNAGAQIPRAPEAIVPVAPPAVLPPVQPAQTVQQIEPREVAAVDRAAEKGAAPVVAPEAKISRAIDIDSPGKNIYPSGKTAAVVADVSVAPPVAVTAMPSAPVAPTSWDAKAGEDMKIVLSRWAERAGYDLQWQADQDGKVAQDIALKGSFEDAVTQLLAENSAATGIAAHVEGTQGGKKDLASRAGKVSPATVSSQSAPVQAIIPALHTDWSAPAGANIQTILDQWASKAGVKVIWQSYIGVPIKKNIEMTGSFESAVQTLLDQYQADSKRPIGQLNIDPDSGQRTLLMDMDKSS